MPTKLENLLVEIDPSRTIDLVENRINNALAKYYREKNTVDSWEEYQECLADIVERARNAALDIPLHECSDIEMNFGLALQYLKKRYSKNTLQAVFDIMSTGAEGGIYRILKTLAIIIAEESSQNEITNRVVDYWDNLPPDEKLSAADEYINKYRDILPRGVEKNIVRFKASFLKVLEQHPRMIKSMRDLGHYHWKT